MRKIFSILFASLFLILLLTISSQKIHATTPCEAAGGTCQLTSSTCPTGKTKDASLSCNTFSSLFTCCKPSTSSTGSTDSTGSSTAPSIPNGSYGCSFKLPTDGTTTVPLKDMLIPCQSGGVCLFDKNKSSIQLESGHLVLDVINGLCASVDNQCPICDSGYEYSNQTLNCISASDPTKQKQITKIDPCKAGVGCNPGVGCVEPGAMGIQPLSVCQNGTSCSTALGDLPTNLSALLTRVFSIALSIAGVVALGLIIASGYRLMISQGNPEQVKGAREQLTAAIVGLLFIVFSLIILLVISVNILKIPGFG